LAAAERVDGASDHGGDMVGPRDGEVANAWLAPPDGETACTVVRWGGSRRHRR